MNLVLRLENDALLALNTTNENLRQTHVGEFKFALVTALLQADIKDVDAAAQRANADLGTIVFPSHRCDRVVILNLLAGNLVPGGALCVVVEGVEAVEITDNAGLTGGIEGCTGELLDTLVL